MINHPIIQGYIKGNEFGRYLGMDFSIEGRGKVYYKMVVSENHLATPSTAHGGVLAALADAGLGVGALSVSAEFGNIVSTVEFKISYIAPAKLNDRLILTSKLVRAGKSIIFMEAQIINQNNELIAQANGTFNQYPVDKLLSILNSRI